MCLQRSRRTPSHFDLYQWHPQSNVVKPKKHPSYQLDVILPQILVFFSSQSQHWGCQLARALSRALALTLHLEIFFLGYWVDPILLGRCWRFWNWMIHDDSMYTYVHTQSYICIYIAHKRNPFLWFRIYINNSLVLSSFLGHSKKIAQVNAFSCQKLERWASWGFKTLCLSGWWTGFPMMDYI